MGEGMNEKASLENQRHSFLFNLIVLLFIFLNILKFIYF